MNKQPSRRKKQSGDATENGEAEVEDMRRRMASAAEKDNNDRQAGEPARHKLKLLPEVVALLNKNNLRESICDPDINLLEAVRFFLEPLSDGSLPAYDIQKELIAALGKLPINKESLVASGIGKVILFYMKSKRPEKHIKLQAERLFTDWTRPILRRTDDFRKKEFAEKAFDPRYVVRSNHRVECFANCYTANSRRPVLLNQSMPPPLPAPKLSRRLATSSARAWSLAL